MSFSCEFMIFVSQIYSVFWDVTSINIVTYKHIILSLIEKNTYILKIYFYIILYLSTSSTVNFTKPLYSIRCVII